MHVSSRCITCMITVSWCFFLWKNGSKVRWQSFANDILTFSLSIGNRTVIAQSTMNQIGLNLGHVQLVVRVDNCEPAQSQVSVLISPPPTFSNNGITKVNIGQGAGEQLIPPFSFAQCEIQFQQTSTQCSLANSYLVMCVLDQYSACQVRVFDKEKRLLECNCDKTAPNYSHFIFSLVILVLLIWLSKYFCNNNISLLLTILLPRSNPFYRCSSRKRLQRRNRLWYCLNARTCVLLSDNLSSGMSHDQLWLQQYKNWLWSSWTQLGAYWKNSSIYFDQYD